MNRPGNTISCRIDDKGGAVSPQAKEVPDDALNARHVVVLVHGFNNDLETASRAYDRFQCGQRALDGDANDPVASDPIVEAYWPGDANWGVASFLVYPLSVGKAKESALRIAALLRLAAARTGVKVVDFVAHSLGCRLTLEILRELQRDPGLVQVRRVVLMAAAVPTFMLERGGHLWTVLAPSTVERTLSLCSNSDMVLKLAFPAGQSLAGLGEGLAPTALGAGIWLSATGVIQPLQAPVHGAGHGDYWGPWDSSDSGTTPSRQANVHVRNFLGLGRQPSRTVPGRETVSRRLPTRTTG